MKLRWLWVILTILLGVLTFISLMHSHNIQSATTKPSYSRVRTSGQNYLVVTLNCGDNSFNQQLVDTVDFKQLGNYFWAGYRPLDGDYNYDGTRSAADIINLVNLVFKGSEAIYYPETVHVAIYYDESSGQKIMKFVERLPNK